MILCLSAAAGSGQKIISPPPAGKVLGRPLRGKKIQICVGPIRSALSSGEHRGRGGGTTDEGRGRARYERGLCCQRRGTRRRNGPQERRQVEVGDAGDTGTASGRSQTHWSGRTVDAPQGSILDLQCPSLLDLFFKPQVARPKTSRLRFLSGT